MKHFFFFLKSRLESSVLLPDVIYTTMQLIDFVQQHDKLFTIGLKDAAPHLLSSELQNSSKCCFFILSFISTGLSINSTNRELLILYIYLFLDPHLLSIHR